MNSVALTGKRKFPLTTDALAFMQAAWSMLENFSKLGGDNYILSGCTVTGSSASSGMVVIGGRLMSFAGGSIQSNVKVVTTQTAVTVGAGTREQTTYAAEFGTSTNAEENVSWETLNANRIDNLLALKTGVAALNDKLIVTQQQLDKVKTAFIGSVSNLGEITTMVSLPGFEISVAIDAGGFMNFTHNIGHVRYLVTPVISDAVDNVFICGIIQKTETGFRLFCNNTETLQRVAMHIDFSITVCPV